MAEWVVFIAVAAVSCAVGFGPFLLDWGEEIIYRAQSRRQRAGIEEAERLSRHQRTLARIDELERELEIGKYSPEAKELDRLMAEQEVEERRERQIEFDRIFGERRKESRRSVYGLKREIMEELGYNASGDYVSVEAQAELAAAARALSIHEKRQEQIDSRAQEIYESGGVSIYHAHWLARREARYSAEGEAKPVDDSFADYDIRDGKVGPKTRGAIRRIVDTKTGEWSEIRSFGG